MRRLQLDISNFQRRVLQDCLTEAMYPYWERRAYQFDAVDPNEQPLALNARPEVVAGASTAAQTALACRRQAWLIKQDDGLPAHVGEEIATVLQEVA
jgi:hypothetical protein